MGWASNTRKKLNKVSECEKIVHELLNKYGISHHRNWGFQVKGGKYRFVDFFIRSKKIIIEVDGPEHVEEKDKLREQEILKTFTKYTFIRFTNYDVLHNKEKVANIIKSIKKITTPKS